MVWPSPIAQEPVEREAAQLVVAALRESLQPQPLQTSANADPVVMNTTRNESVTMTAKRFMILPDG